MRAKLKDIAILMVGAYVVGLGGVSGYNLFLYLTGEVVGIQEVQSLIEMARQECIDKSR